MKTKKVAELLYEWYASNKRDLPWRKTKDPYTIWISEIILQQTRVDQGTPYYLRFLDRFPTVLDLAKASEEEVLLVWQGLGYYSRARNMHYAANQVMQQHQGVFPSAYEQLILLKGIGRYTAAAISSITASEKKAVVDGNVIRLISRLWGIEAPVDQAKTVSLIEGHAQSLIEEHDSGVQNQALMEYGATVCTPRNPACATCILHPHCSAFKTNKQTEIPFKKGKVSVTTRHFQYLYLTDKQGRFLVYQRPAQDIWQGLFELPMIEKEKLTPKEIGIWLGFTPTSMGTMGKLKHQLSHQSIHATLWTTEVSTLQLEQLAETKFLTILNAQELTNYPISKLMENFFLLIQNEAVK